MGGYCYTNVSLPRLWTVLRAETSQLSSTTSTPAGAFSAALAILCASAAVLWVCGGIERRKGGDGGGGDNDVEIKRLEKDPRVASLQRRFLAIFWLLRMADWLQVREREERKYRHQLVSRLTDAKSGESVREEPRTTNHIIRSTTYKSPTFVRIKL